MKRFKLEEHGTSVRQELMAGLVAFLTSVYIVAINASILADAGVPLAGAALATIITCFIGCCLMGLWSNAPIVLIPGMGINAMFTYTFVQNAGLTWQEALGVVFVAGLVFMAIAFTKLADLLANAIPENLKYGITAGIGLFLAFIGLQKGGLLQSNPDTFIQLASLTDPMPLATIITLIIALFLFARNVPGHFLWTILTGVAIGMLLNVQVAEEALAVSLQDAASVVGQFSFHSLLSVTFWTSVFALAMVLTFENIGLISGYTKTLNRPDKAKKALQANAVSAASAGFFGTSPTVSTAETAAGIAAGGKTGLASIMTGALFALALLALPFLSYIPDSAIAPILIIVGGLMLKEVSNVSFESFSSWFPAYIIIAGIPLTHSIADGIAFGFVSYPILYMMAGRQKEVSKTMYVVGALFLIHLIFTALST